MLLLEVMADAGMDGALDLVQYGSSRTGSREFAVAMNVFNMPLRSAAAPAVNP